MNRKPVDSMSELSDGTSKKSSRVSSSFSSSDSGWGTSGKTGGGNSKVAASTGNASSSSSSDISSSSSDFSSSSSSASTSRGRTDQSSRRSEALPTQDSASTTRSFYFLVYSSAIEGRPPPPSGPGAAAALEELYGPHLSVLCLNAYLIPPIVSWNPYLWAPFWSCKRPQERAEQIGRLSAQYDIVCLQEVWGTNLGGLNSWVLPTHSILPETQSGSSLGWVGEIVDPVRLYTRRTGGMWFAWRMAKAKYIGMERHLFDPNTRVPFSNQNITVVELDVSNTFPGKRLILIGTHFSVLGKNPRAHNLQELQDFCRKVVWKQYLHWLARQLSGTAGASGGPDAAPSFIADTAILVLGDFNMDPTKCPRDYKKLCTLGGCAEMRDLFAKEFNPNYGAQFTEVSQEGRKETRKKDGSVKYSGNSLFPWPFRGRVDYIFALDSLYLKPDEVLELVEEFPPEEVVAPEFEELDIPILKEGGLVVTFDKITCLGMDIVAQRYGEELSDHWPLSARICLGRPAVKPEALPCPRKGQLLRGSSLCMDSSYAGGTKPKQPVDSLEAERGLPANQLAGWRQSMAPASLEPSPEVLLLRQQREERKHATAAAAAAAAEAAELELQRKLEAYEYGSEESSVQEGDDNEDMDNEQYEEQAAEVQERPEQEPAHSVEKVTKKGAPLAAQRAQANVDARKKPLRM